MSTIRSRILKGTALCLALAVTHVCLSAELVRAATSRLVAKATAAQGGAQGRLTTRGNNLITVNGNSAKSGETIFSGQSLQTPARVGATVNLPGIGRVDIAPNSNLTLTFEAGKVHIALVSGCVILTSNSGNAGSVEHGGTTERTEGGVIDICSSATPGGAPVVGQGAAASAGAGASGGTTAAAAAATTATVGGGGISTATTVILVATTGAVTGAAVIIATNDGGDPSPSAP